MNRVRTLAVTALSAAVIAGGVSLSTATSAAADPTGGIDDPDELTSEQIDNARTIIGVGKGADLSKDAQTIAVMTALQESSLQNLDGGDRDSAGAFQQRPSVDWGSTDEVTDPVYSSKAFYGINPESPNPGRTEIDQLGEQDPACRRAGRAGLGLPRRLREMGTAGRTARRREPRRRRHRVRPAPGPCPDPARIRATPGPGLRPARRRRGAGPPR